MSGQKGESSKMSDDSRWSNKELYEFARALQCHGFRNTKKIAMIVKTKSENAVKAMIALNMGRARRQLNCGSGKRGRKSNFHSLRPREWEAASWPPLRKWQKIMQNQQMDCVRKVDYSNLVVPEIFDRFRDEAGERPENAQAVDFGAIYGYLGECVRGQCPPELPPKESAILLMVVKFTYEMMVGSNLTEELDFAKGFKKATSFVPFQVKDEFKKREKQVSVVCPPGSVPIPEEVHSGLSRHRKVVQSFNPMTIPLWLLLKEQRFFTNMFENARRS